MCFSGFVFEAFLPPDKKEHKLALERLKNETRTMIVYEAPHHLLKTLRELLEILGNRRLTLCRELTKKHETAWQTTIEDALAATIARHGHLMQIRRDSQDWQRVNIP